MLYTALIAPFIDYGFMRSALVASLALSLAVGPLGSILVLRRMSLVGDALSHGILPGVALGFLWAGLSLPVMSLGGFLSGLVVALGSGLAARLTQSAEDASFASFYLISLAVGVILVAGHGNNVDLLRVLFGSILGVDHAALLLIASLSSVALMVMAVIWRPLVAECFDPQFMAAWRGRGGWWHGIFLVMLVLILVASFQTLGTLMAIGLLMLPATAARFCSRSLSVLVGLASVFAGLASGAGLLISFHFGLPAGPAIILVAGGIYVLTLLGGRFGAIRPKLPQPHHLRA
ncbi:MAG: metal ABC transporter permease [Candidatus Symbiobacter sp.]|nr:metal ABC transporter permease [Candidatus Symbiobacter sp.]